MNRFGSFFLVLLMGFSFSAGAKELSPATVSSSSFPEACPGLGKARAGKIKTPGVALSGPDALGRQGDYYLQNNRAAFVVQGLDQVNTYYYYGGILIDAVAMEGSEQACSEQFEELGLFIGEVNKDDFLASGVRAFRGKRVEIKSDGSDGEAAVIRVHGTDDFFWIVELELFKMMYNDLNIPKHYTRPLGLDLYVDYILPPDSRVLRIEFNIRNRGDERRHVFTGAGAFFGNSTIKRYYHDGLIYLADFSVHRNLPFLVSASNNGAWAIGMDNASLGTANLSGFDVFFDTRQLMQRIELMPAGEPGDTARVIRFMAVGDSDFNSALVNLHRENPEPIRGWNVELEPFSGKAVDSETGEPVQGATIEVQVRNRLGQWTFLDGFMTDREGNFEGRIPRLGRKYRLTAKKEGRRDPGPVYFRLKDRDHIELKFSPPGHLSYNIKDRDGRALPAKIGLYRDGELSKTVYTGAGPGVEPLKPGSYRVNISRGYEYVPYEGEIEVMPGHTARLSAELSHAVDTSGFLSADMHVHAGPSGDNDISIPERILTVGAEGLDVVVATDHEAVIPWQPGVEETGLQDWVATVLGEEVTATIPEHINMFPVEPRFDIDARGGPIRWYGMDIAEVYNAIRERGAGIVQLNHPLGYFEMIEYNLGTGKAELAHPEYIGLKPGDSLWSWDLDSFEFQNGCKPVFGEAMPKRKAGTFEYWMSFLNLGHRVTAVANSDAHDYSPPGHPRNYFSCDARSPAGFKEEMLTRAVKEGRVLTSTGAFAEIKINRKAGMGDTVMTSDNTVDLWLRIQAIPQIDVSHFKVFVNCDQVMNVPVEDTGQVVKYEGELNVPVSRDSHIVVMGFGKEKLPEGFKQFDPLGVPRFATNPVYIDHGGDGYTPPGWDGCSYTLP
ncbi:MAG: CehA/McbA family metallohydrolase [bacterium]